MRIVKLIIILEKKGIEMKNNSDKEFELRSLKSKDFGLVNVDLEKIRFRSNGKKMKSHRGFEKLVKIKLDKQIMKKKIKSNFISLFNENKENKRRLWRTTFFYCQYNTTN